MACEPPEKKDDDEPKNDDEAKVDEKKVGKEDLQKMIEDEQDRPEI